MKILLLNDDEGICRVLCDLLKDHSVFYTPYPEEALKFIDACNPELALIDLSLFVGREEVSDRCASVGIPTVIVSGHCLENALSMLKEGEKFMHICDLMTFCVKKKKIEDLFEEAYVVGET